LWSVTLVATENVTVTGNLALGGGMR
jgi:hypothetical protein